MASTLVRGVWGSFRKRGPYEGAVLPPVREVWGHARVDPDRLAAYTRVCGFPPPEAGRPLPVTYPHVLGFGPTMRLMSRRDFPFPLLGLVHTDIEIRQQGPLDPAEQPELRVWAEDLEPHRRGSRFTVVTEVLRDGEAVWHSRSGYLCRHRREQPVEGTRPPAPAPLPVRGVWELPGDLGRRYGAASGDRNPIHLHPLTARAFGFPRAIAHGMWTFARCLAEAGPEAEGERLRARAEFRAPVPLPTRVALGRDGHRFELRKESDPERLHLTGEWWTG
ncbi:MaoC/PaaZ C-terminal domain-containing protein [Streptomyces sp. NPDC005438]|uniref:MaoC family dehydratase n=1 Tax=Streptomyces sp. NPDC005438 TaxID=3156880 RepID=UPI0033A9E121